MISSSGYNEGTKILCLVDGKDTYINIEYITNKNLVKTYLHGYRRCNLIGKSTIQNNPNTNIQCMFILPKMNNIFNKSTDDLIIRGSHSVLVDRMPSGMFLYKKIDNKCLLMASTTEYFKKLSDNNEYTYYQLCLENDGDNSVKYGIWANGVLSETLSYKEFMQEQLEPV